MGLTKMDVSRDELSLKASFDEAYVGGADSEVNEEGWRRGAKRSRGSGNNFFTLTEVEQKVQRALANDPGSIRRASDDTWRKKDQKKIAMTNSGDSRGKRKLSEPLVRGEEGLEKKCMKGGRTAKQAGTVTKNKNGSGLAEADNQPRRPQ
jgi:hypothetical protein